jgi:RNA polymerase sigma-70 factor (ECF subfamily)
MTGMLDEKALLSGARRYEEEILGEIYDRCSPSLYRYAVRQLGEPDLAEECVADTFSRFLGALRGGGGPRKHLKSYLYRMAHNWIVDFRRSHPATELVLDPEVAGSDDARPGKILQDQLEIESMNKALLQLTSDQRQVILLKFGEDLSNREIAAVLDKTQGAVKALQHRGRAALKRLMIGQEQPYD